MPFHRTKENFVCEHCGAEVIGTGYTNHCPQCLWSKHVDVYPGDRKEPCGGLMEPIAIDIQHGKEIILHRCQRCGAERKNKAAANDDAEMLIIIAANRSRRVSHGE